MVGFYLRTFPRFPLRKKEHKSYVGKNRTHDFRTSRCAGYLLDHSGDDGFCILTKQANHQLIRCVTVRRSSLEAPESDHNVVYMKVHIPRRSAPNRCKRDSIKETMKTADVRLLMADPNLRCQVAMVATLPLIPNGTCTSDIATEMTDVMLPTVAELTPRSRRP